MENIVKLSNSGFGSLNLFLTFILLIITIFAKVMLESIVGAGIVKSLLRQSLGYFLFIWFSASVSIIGDSFGRFVDAFDRYGTFFTNLFRVISATFELVFFIVLIAALLMSSLWFLSLSVEVLNESENHKDNLSGQHISYQLFFYLVSVCLFCLFLYLEVSFLMTAWQD